MTRGNASDARDKTIFRLKVSLVFSFLRRRRKRQLFPFTPDSEKEEKAILDLVVVR